jgi:restriction system protein
MPRYWVIAPVESKNAELFDKVWQFDVAENLISIGWSELGDISRMDRESLVAAIASTYAGKPATTRGLYANMLWSFYHEVVIGDLVVARRGRKTLAGIGKVVHPAEYFPGKNPFLARPGHSHDSFLGIEWQTEPRNKSFGTLVFPMHTLTEFSEEQYRSLLDNSDAQTVVADVHGQPQDHDVPVNADIVLEKYLEEFIVSNFDAIFRGKYRFYVESEELDGQQYPTGVGAIDILAVELQSRAFVVIELKKGRPSDQVVGQILRYMGWVKENLCKEDQPVKGLVICHDPDPKLSYALRMTENIDVRYYNVSFNLREQP